ncbi:MAG: DnaA regulatory inactivator Hda [Gammaproteobacteria bacterium]|nr:DnaA regulatory inactivator Hda [Gammaproteobacteria bacterium]
MKSHPGQQLPLRIGLRDGATFTNFYPGPNAAAVHALQAAREPFLYLGGPPGCGRSHLLQAACHAVSEAGGLAAYLPLEECMAMSPQMLAGMEQMALLALDDVERLAGNAEWEQALFHLYNRMRDAGHRLIVVGNAPPAALGIALPDLLSRLGWGPVFQLQPLSDSEKSAALRLRANQRGMELPAEVADYLLNHASREMPDLIALLERLDEGSLAAQRRLTIPFVRPFIS